MTSGLLSEISKTTCVKSITNHLYLAKNISLKFMKKHINHRQYESMECPLISRSDKMWPMIAAHRTRRYEMFRTLVIQFKRHQTIFATTMHSSRASKKKVGSSMMSAKHAKNNNNVRAWRIKRYATNQTIFVIEATQQSLPSLIKSTVIRPNRDGVFKSRQ